MAASLARRSDVQSMRWLFGIALLAVGVAASLEVRFLYGAREQQLIDVTAPAQGSPLQLLSYNVKGTPWPPLSDRTPDLRAIGAFLRSERGQGVQPHVVVL